MVSQISRSLYLLAGFPSLQARYSISSLVPSQWLQSTIIPIVKLPKPNCSDYRLISLMSILSKILEKLIVRHFIYPILPHPDLSSSLSLSDQCLPSGQQTPPLWFWLPSSRSSLTTWRSAPTFTSLPLISVRLFTPSSTTLSLRRLLTIPYLIPFTTG